MFPIRKAKAKLSKHRSGKEDAQGESVYSVKETKEFYKLLQKTYTYPGITLKMFFQWHFLSCFILMEVMFAKTSLTGMMMHPYNPGTGET